MYWSLKQQQEIINRCNIVCRVMLRTLLIIPLWSQSQLGGNARRNTCWSQLIISGGVAANERAHASPQKLTTPPCPLNGTVALSIWASFCGNRNWNCYLLEDLSLPVWNKGRVVEIQKDHLSLTFLGGMIRPSDTTSLVIICRISFLFIII